MRFELDVDYSPDEMRSSRERLEARESFRIRDRVPVTYCITPRYFAPIFDVPYLDLFHDVESQYYWLLQFAKYHIENIPSDYCASPVIYVHPFFDNAIPATAQGAAVDWSVESPLRAIPTIHTVDDMERFCVADPEGGLRGTAIRWWLEMRDLASVTRVTFGGQEGRVEVAPLTLGGLSPHMLAIDLVGDDFYWWMLEYPAACHRFLRKILEGEIKSEENVRRIDPRPRDGIYWLAEDSAQIMSASMFKEFCVPYANPLFERFGQTGRTVHMCGDSVHLLQAVKEDMRMTHFDLFGYLVDPFVAAANLGGTTRLRGNLNPMLMKDGKPDDVRKAAWECLNALGPGGGLVLADGANVCPGTPLASFQAIMQAARDWGRGPVGAESDAVRDASRRIGDADAESAAVM